MNGASRLSHLAPSVPEPLRAAMLRALAEELDRRGPIDAALERYQAGDDDQGRGAACPLALASRG